MNLPAPSPDFALKELVEEHPQVRAIALELLYRFPPLTAPALRELDGIGSLAAVLEILCEQVCERGCDLEWLRMFAQIHTRIRDRLDDLGCSGTGPRLSAILSTADEISSATLALMPTAGSA